MYSITASDIASLPTHHFPGWALLQISETGEEFAKATLSRQKDELADVSDMHLNF